MENMDIDWKCPKCRKIYLPQLSAQAQKLGFRWKKASLDDIDHEMLKITKFYFQRLINNHSEDNFRLKMLDEENNFDWGHFFNN